MIKNGIENLKAAAESRGGECLSSTYIKASSKYKFRCEKGHEWEASYGHIVGRGSWCIICAGKKVNPDDRLIEAKEVALSKGGFCQSEKYIGGHKNLKWQCAKGHQWEATFTSVVGNNAWCGLCAGVKVNPEEMIQKAREAAIKNGGECLSDTYINANTSLKWICGNGHEWYAKYASVIRNGSWCGICVGQHVDPVNRIKIARETAIIRGGKCLSETYIDKKKMLRWRCSEGHEWDANYQNVVTGKTWCGFCDGYHVVPEESLKKAKELAIKNGGLCLSDTYTGSKSKLNWRCNRGHEWQANFASVVNNGNWCAICSEGVKERLCRDVLEQLFSAEFKKVRPKWLKNPKTGFSLELDGYNEKLGLAFEYQGSQHYKIVNSFKMTDKTLETNQYRDALKKSLCVQHHIQIIEIPYTINVTQLSEFISTEISANNNLAHLIPLMKDWRTLPVKKWLESDSYEIEDLQRLALEKGGECLSPYFMGADKKHHWKCSKGHDWMASWTSVNKVGRWCPECVGRMSPEKNLKKLSDVAISRGGILLSTTYLNSSVKLKWQCKEGHQWEAKPGDVKNGSWCPLCSRLTRKFKHELKKRLNNKKTITTTNTIYNPPLTCLRMRYDWLQR